MRGKLKLELEHLQVDSFDTSNPEPAKGTVFGEQCTCYTNCTCPGCPTCDHTACGQNTCDGATCGGNTCDGAYTCAGTCGDTCYNTCGAGCGGTFACGTQAWNTGCGDIHCA